MPASNELRLFLSSTFIDFQGERDYLAKKVFPRLRSVCRDRGVEFTEIDLRWGLTQEDAERGRIIGTCLEEIDSCRPFFVGLLGERYGWVPGMEELEKDSELRKTYPWIESSFQSGHSVTEMEFRHGFLNHASDGPKPLVYFRSSLQSKEQDERISRLKEEVVRRLGSVPTFQTPAELATLIERDLYGLIERNWPASEQRSWLDEERAGHAAFAQSRRKGYVPNPTVVDSMNSHLDRPEPVLVITGESGSGKSSLLSYWAESLRQQDPKLFIVEHYIGVTAASTDPDTLMRRIVEEIKERTRSEDPVPQSAAELERSFPAWLGRMTGERMLILVDAINQLNTDGRFMAWLPEHLQSNIRWVISATQSDALARLRDWSRLLGHSLPEIAVTPITVPERRRVLRTYLANYQKKLDRKQEEQIVKDAKASSPLFLRTMLEELRLHGKHESLDEFITHYLSSADIPDLFARILARIENDYGSVEVQTLLTHIWAAPHGLSETEIIASGNLDRATLSLLLHAFDYHLIRVKGRLSFFHDHLRQAVEGRYLFEQDRKRGAWLQVASYFRTAEASSIKAQSLPWLLSKAEQWPWLKDSLLDISLMPYLTEGSRSYDLLGYWNTLEKREEAAGRTATKERKLWNIDVVSEYERSLAQHSDALDPLNECKIRYSLALFFRNAGWFEGAITNAARALELCEAILGASCSEVKVDTELGSLLLDICLELGKAYLDKGDLNHAGETLEKALRILGDDVVAEKDNSSASVDSESTNSPNFDLRHINIRNEYVRLLKDQGKYAEAERISKITLRSATDRFGTAHFATQNEMKWLADILKYEGKLEEAELLHRAVIKSVEVSLGPDSLDLAYYINEFVGLLRQKDFRAQAKSQVEINPMATNHYIEAQQLMERAVSIIESRLGGNHPDLGQLLNYFGALHSQYGNSEKAEPLFLRSLDISEKVLGSEHPNIAFSLNNYAGFLARQGKYEQSEVPYRRALAIRRTAFGEDHPETAFIYNNLANVLRMQAKYDEAEECYKHALRIRLNSFGTVNADTARTLEGMGRLMKLRGDFTSSEDYLNRSYASRIQCLGQEHHDTIFVALELAEVLLEESNAGDARRIVMEILTAVGSENNIPDDLKEKYGNIIKKLT